MLGSTVKSLHRGVIQAAFHVITAIHNSERRTMKAIDDLKVSTDAAIAAVEAKLATIPTAAEAAANEAALVAMKGNLDALTAKVTA